ncbi:hypothetical protein K440DRAFT_664297 [Wilcoxina mikolae CBS 423.85]|nr:hypothetical protein K440DRAFT_664297 [Wilcoxina mikolae CBS 423.85]
MKLSETILRLLQLIFTTIMLGLCGGLLQQQTHGGTPTRLNYSMWALALAALSLFYLIPSIFIPSIRSPIAVITLDAINFIFLLCAGIAMAASLGGNSCSDPGFLGRNGIVNGGGVDANRQKRCREANALTAFEWFAAAAFAGSAVIALYEMKKVGDTRRLHGRRPDMRSSGV